jgi:putative DNA primase/helicase
MPYQPLHPSWKAKANDATTWGTAAQAIAAYQRNNGGDYFDGIGIELDGNGLAKLCAIDLDNCRNPQTGDLHPWVKRLIERSNSYAEITPSAQG